MFSAESSTHAVAGVHETGGIIIMHYANCSKIPLEKEVAIPSGLLAWRIPWTEEPGGLQSMGLQRVRHD